MTFKAYDILASLIPGFLGILVLLQILNLDFDKDFVVGYTALGFLLGYVINTLGSWLEDFYFLTWGGKPSTKLLKGKGIWKVKFYESAKVNSLLIADASRPNAAPDELFSIAMRSANGEARVDDFNAQYAFSRSLLTVVLIGTILMLWKNYDSVTYYFLFLPILFVTWLRCKQRGYYYAREVLNTYIKSK